MKVEVRLFAQARDAAGAERVTVELPEAARVGDLRAALAARWPEIALPGLQPARRGGNRTRRRGNFACPRKVKSPAFRR